MIIHQLNNKKMWFVIFSFKLNSLSFENFVLQKLKFYFSLLFIFQYNGVLTTISSCCIALLILNISVL